MGYGFTREGRWASPLKIRRLGRTSDGGSALSLPISVTKSGRK